MFRYVKQEESIMIVSDLAHATQFESVHPLFAKAFAFLREHDFLAMEPGRIDIEGPNLYALVQAYQTADPSLKKWETHEAYMDIQYMAAGTEICGWAPAGTMEPAGDYNPEKDIRFYVDSGPHSPIRLQRGSFAILMPEDIHRPGCLAFVAENVCKVVLKVRI
jgi:YhcH/YjgK/YiaL family protein